MKYALPFSVYLVGGCVRDQLLGIAIQDRDWVVVGATPSAMLSAGYTQVGADFPVFLHPETKDEYALARIERKRGRGYHGFDVQSSPDVTLEDDLRRRDLTINAMARAPEGALIDPYGGQRDLAAKIFRHVSAAFAEDPLRVLRLARFSARLSDFTVAPETAALAKSLAYELPALPAERVWQEIARGLMERAPARMLQVLQEVEAWSVLFPEIPAAQIGTISAALQTLAEGDLQERFAILAFAGDAKLAQRLKAPRECAALAQLSRDSFENLIGFAQLSAEKKLDTVLRGDALRRPARWLQAQRVCGAWARATGKVSDFAPQVLKIQTAIARVDPGAIAREVPAAQIPDQLRTRRIAEILKQNQ